MRAACGRVVPHRGFPEIPDSIVRAHNSCAQLIETEEPAADIFKNRGSDVAKNRPRYIHADMHARRTRPPGYICTLAISYRGLRRMKCLLNSYFWRP